jgi:cysteine-rich repeat protein
MQRTMSSSKLMIPAGIPVLLLAALPFGCKPECMNVIADDGHGNRTICDTETGSGTTTESTTGETSTTTTTSGMTTTLTSTTTNATTTVTTTTMTTMSTTTTEDTSSSTTAVPVCGDGTVDAGEECDDMGESSECDEDCTLAFCGDGHVNKTAGETCEVAESTAECEVATCKTPACGDGYINESAGEECEDGNGNDGDGCSSTCTVEHRLVFVTSKKFDPTLGGLTGADAKCQELAEAAMKSGTFKAWLSDSMNGPSTRFGINPAFSGPFELMDGTAIAEGWADLTDGTLLHAIDMDEAGATKSSTVWTSTTTDGIKVGTGHCLNWTAGTGANQGALGTTDYSDLNWSSYVMFPTAPCNSSASLYCFQVQ